MEIFLNEKLLQIDGLESESKFSELVVTVEDSLKGSGATIIEIVADGQNFSPDDNDQLEELKVMDYTKIELVCATAQQMIRLAIEDGADGLEHLEENAMDVSADLRVGKIKDAMEKYLQFLDGLEWFTTMLKNADKAFAAAMAESSLETERQSLMQRLAEQTSAVQASQEGEDWVGLADILEYEFPEILQDGSGLFHKILESADS